LKICFICNEYPPARHGGIGTLTRTLARALVQAGNQVRVVGFCSEKEVAPEMETDCGVSVHRFKISCRPLEWVRARYFLYTVVRRWAQEGLIDLVEVPDYEGLAAGWPALRIPVIIRMHGSSTYFGAEMRKRHDAIMSLIEGASLRRGNFLCSCSHYTAERSRELFRLGESKIAILHNPVVTETASFERKRHTGQVVFSGTLTAKKGVGSLVRAWAEVLEKCPQAELAIFGKDGRTDRDSSMQDHLISLVPPPIRNTIHFHGHVDFARLRSAFRSASVAVFPSYSEAFALAPMEAMAQGCPTIYSCRASGRELIQDGENGLLVNPDDPKEIADAIIRILTNPQIAKELGSKGKKSIECRFSLNVLLVRNINFYLDCLRSFAEGLTEPTN
jgi:glycosyltransferase involved in cell wall biosynthesis